MLLFAAALFVGFLAHIRAAYREAVGDEGMLWLWTKAPKTSIEQWGRYTFYAWLGSCLLLFAPIEIKVAIGIQALFLFAHLTTLSFRN